MAPSLPDLPPFSSLPLDPSGPPGNAWGLFGEKDELGMLNLLTPEVVREASKEIQEGVRVSLDWALNMPRNPSFNRRPFEHRLKSKAPRTVNDDELTFNTQGSSQWDGFRHYGYQHEKKFFNGHTQDELESSTVIGIDVWVANGGIVGRGVLLDYAAWAESHNIPISVLTSSTISVSTLKAIAEEKNIKIRPGDILFIRSGFIRSYSTLSPSEEAAVCQRPTPDFIGVEASRDTLQWLWESRFAAVASDSPSWEQGPVIGTKAAEAEVLHPWLLGGWGMPIGEMFDLEALSAECQRLGRWTFFVSSMPLRVPGGVASPPNAVAIL